MNRYVSELNLTMMPHYSYPSESFYRAEKYLYTKEETSAIISGITSTSCNSTHQSFSMEEFMDSVVKDIPTQYLFGCTNDPDYKYRASLMFYLEKVRYKRYTDDGRLSTSNYFDILLRTLIFKVNFDVFSSKKLNKTFVKLEEYMIKYHTQ